MKQDVGVSAAVLARSARHSDAVVSLFSGAGGMSLGFAQAGAKPVLAADVNADACATYAANLGDAIHHVDLASPSDVFEQALSRYHRPFALIGGPPCQGFSSAGLKDGNDERNKLIFSYFGIVERLRPRWFLFENVEGLLTSNGGQSVVELVRQFVREGYRVRLEKLNFAAFGLPQARKRVVLLGNSVGLDFDFPAETHSYHAGKHRGGRGGVPAPSFDDATAGLGRANTAPLVPYESGTPMSDYDALMRAGNGTGGTTLHNPSRLSTQLQQAASCLREGQTMKDLPEELWHDSFRRRAFRRVMDGTPTERRGGAPSGLKRLVGSLNALTITGAAMREFIHPREDRPLTLREAARLQSFPDAYQFSGNSLSIGQQIGNAFPPTVAAALARHLIEIDGRAGAGRGTNRPGALVGFHLTDASGMSPALARTDHMLNELLGQTSLFTDQNLYARRA